MEPLNTGEPPGPDKIRRALAIAEAMPGHGPREGRPHPDVWLGSADALRWALGERTTTPISGREVSFQDDEDAIVYEINYADDCFHGSALPVGGPCTTSYVLGAQDALMWVATGQSYADTFHDWELRDQYRIDPDLPSSWGMT
jgi:hypothetical protein